MSQIDLSQLRIDESAAKPRQPLGPRIFGITVLLIAVAVVLTFLWPLLSPPRLVPTAAIRAANGSSATSTVATAEAVGWVEPDPFPIVIKPLVAGRIQQIHVLEGHAVRAGETVLATLESAELLAALERAKAQLAERDSEHAVAVARRNKAAAHRDQHADHRKAIADAEVDTAGVETALATARGDSERLAATARAATAAKLAQERLTEEGAGHVVALERARAEADAADAAARKAQAEAETILRELGAARGRLALHRELHENAVDLDADVRIAEAEVERADRRRAVAAAELAIAEREQQWAKEVLAPVDGVVLRLIAQPGETTGPAGEGIIAIYDPAKSSRSTILPSCRRASTSPSIRSPGSASSNAPS